MIDFVDIEGKVTNKRVNYTILSVNLFKIIRILPEPGFFLAVVIDGTLPAVVMAGILYILLHIWGNEALTLAYLIIFLVAPPLDE